MESRRSTLTQRHIVLGVTGGIAAYKACYLASRLVQEGAVVDVVMTEAASRFVAPLTFQALTHRPVTTDMFHLLAETEIGHVSLAESADIMVIAPATANTIAEMALGLANDMVTTTALATTAPLVLAPAMDYKMWENPATQENVRRLRERGAFIVDPGVGRLASGLVGAGRMAEPDTILQAIKLVLGRKGDLARWRLLVTAGGTQEPIDPVRYVGNRSTGKMGYAVAEAARDRGAEVTLVTAPTSLPPPAYVQVIQVETARQMQQAVSQAVQTADALVMAAAVADYQPAERAQQKIKKQNEELAIRLTPTPDILAELPESRLVKVGFAAESEDLIAHARDKVRRKRLDLIVANDITAPGSGFGTDTNKVVFIDAVGNLEELPLLPKLEVAHRILDRVVDLLKERML